MTGQRFTRLLVLGYSHTASGSALWRCLCDCGNEALAPGSMLRDGRRKSCGCLKLEQLAARSTTHGHKPRSGATPTYQSWSNMIRRCTNPDHPRYADWGGRGITVDPRWLVFENFLADMGEKPPRLTLERKDNDGPYAPWNCEWATYHQQRVNRRTWLTPDARQEIKRLRASGLTQQVIAERMGVSRSAIRRALASTPG